MSENALPLNKQSSLLEEETRPLVRAWIWFWYNNVTRMLLLVGLHLPVVLLATYAIFGPGEYLRDVAVAAYMLTFCVMLVDNDYTQLRRIGLDVNRVPLRHRNQ